MTSVQGVLETAFPDDRGLIERITRKPPRLRWQTFVDQQGNPGVSLDGWPTYIHRAVELISNRAHVLVIRTDAYETNRACWTLRLPAAAQQRR